MSPAQAGERIRWTPDSDRGSVNSTLSGGRRGTTVVSCHGGDNATQLALMVPGDQSRLLTTKANPTLAWHITTATPVSMTFHVSDPEVATPIYSQTITLEKTALVSATIPQDHSLTTNKQYRWTVFVSCPGEHEAEISARSFVERVNRESLDVNHLPSLEQASSYANQGIWYDAITALLMARSQGVTDAETMVQTLLEQGQSPSEITLSAVVSL
ncbi:DUF928 domain-containing protein [Leptothoe sp. PORK10 BA2]|uniref:DUF928 domain-containing protein n=1 Tax=Leptothoe sp. PORK10 BA2 TaxID=3110254 RepID=UPI002B1E93EF|nr:DUF928 domain-containing protein [Leptothoe sp. PORK10 BA2]MEA5465503.1 DUF928 domain-containing protein [Leptothoe sp. PORK10 BA2]